MKKRFSRQTSSGIALAALALGCGADSVDVGDRPLDADGSPDAGGSPVGGNTRCNIPDLGQYRLLFDSDGGRLERRIYSMRADGTELEALTPESEFAREPAVSPDGTRLAYTTPDGVRLLDLATNESTLFAAGADQPAWAADATRVVIRLRASSTDDG